MRAVGAAEAKKRFGQLLDAVEQGEAIVIIRRGEPIARSLSDLPITLDPQTSQEVWTATQDLAGRYRLPSTMPPILESGSILMRMVA